MQQFKINLAMCIAENVFEQSFYKCFILLCSHHLTVIKVHKKVAMRQFGVHWRLGKRAEVDFYFVLLCAFLAHLA